MKNLIGRYEGRYGNRIYLFQITETNDTQKTFKGFRRTTTGVETPLSGHYHQKKDTDSTFVWFSFTQRTGIDSISLISPDDTFNTMQGIIILGRYNDVDPWGQLRVTKY
jgi:hypothetical protein